MATHLEDGIIDPAYKMFGVDKIFVVNGSIQPTQITANPGLRVEAPVARAADTLAPR